MHPESIDPPWFQELVRRVFERKMRELMKTGISMDDVWEPAMWYVFEVRNDLSKLYKEGGPQK